MRDGVDRDEESECELSRPLYDEDFTLWVEEQVAALRRGDVSALDIDHLIEELQGLTECDARVLGAQLKRIMAHLLKQQYQPQRASRSWDNSIRNGREAIADILDQSPSLRRSLPGLLARNYPRAVAQAGSDTRLPEKAFPADPPFSLDEVLGEAGGGT